MSDDDGPVYERPTITVYPLKQNKRPIGFAPWPPDEPKRSRPSPPPKRRAKPKKGAGPSAS